MLHHSGVKPTGEKCPTFAITLKPVDWKTAQRNNSRHCPLANAIASSVKGATRVMAKNDGIAFSVGDRRYYFPHSDKTFAILSQWDLAGVRRDQQPIRLKLSGGTVAEIQHWRDNHPGAVRRGDIGKTRGPKGKRSKRGRGNPAVRNWGVAPIDSGGKVTKED
jgi:hypothetical protein